MSKEIQVEKKENISETSRVKGKLRGAKDGIPFGDPRNPVPSVAAQNAGKLRKKTGVELGKLLLQTIMGGKEFSGEVRKLAANHFGISEDDVTFEIGMHYKQIEAALKEGNTFAYNAFMNRALGMPKQVTEEIGTGTVINVNIEGENDNVIPRQGKVVNG